MSGGERVWLKTPGLTVWSSGTGLTLNLRAVDESYSLNPAGAYAAIGSLDHRIEELEKAKNTLRALAEEQART